MDKKFIFLIVALFLVSEISFCFWGVNKGIQELSSAANRMVRVANSLDIKISEEIIEYIFDTYTISVPEGYSRQELLENIPEFMLDHIKQRAGLYQMNLSQYSDLVKHNTTEALGLVEEIRKGFIPQGSLTYLFRFLISPVKDYFDRVIKMKAEHGKLSFTIKSVGSAKGLEAYSVAMILYDRLENYAKENISRDNSEIEEWIGSWDIEIQLYDVNFNSLLKAKQAVYTAEEIEFMEEDYNAQYSSYLEGLKAKYIHSIADGKVEIAKEITKGFNFSFRYIDLEDAELFQQRRLANTSHELVMFINVGLMHSLEIAIRNILIDSFNRDYEGLGFWSSTEMYVYKP